MCKHRVVKKMTEADGCYWLQCARCGGRGPKRHSLRLAVQQSLRLKGE